MCLAKWKALIEDPSQAIDQKKKDVKVDVPSSPTARRSCSPGTRRPALMTSYDTAGIGRRVERRR